MKFAKNIWDVRVALGSFATLNTVSHHHVQFWNEVKELGKWVWRAPMAGSAIEELKFVWENDPDISGRHSSCFTRLFDHIVKNQFSTIHILGLGSAFACVDHLISLLFACVQQEELYQWAGTVWQVLFSCLRSFSFSKLVCFWYKMSLPLIFRVTGHTSCTLIRLCKQLLVSQTTCQTQRRELEYGIWVKVSCNTLSVSIWKIDRGHEVGWLRYFEFEGPCWRLRRLIGMEESYQYIYRKFHSYFFSRNWRWIKPYRSVTNSSSK